MSSRPSSFHRRLIDAIPNLRAFAMSLCGNPARSDDLVQETLLKAWNKIDSFEEGTNFRAWLFTILRNTFLSEQRKRKREIADIDGLLSRRLAVHPEQFGHMDMSDFLAALQRLPRDQREALLLIGAEGFSYEEVAVISGCAVGTVKSRVNRARVHLCQILGLQSIAEFGPDQYSAALASRDPLRV